MAKPVHSMIRVLDEAKSLDFYARAFGLEIADRLAFAGFRADLSAPSLLAVRGRTDREFRSQGALRRSATDTAISPWSSMIVDAEHARFEREKLSPGPLRDFKHDGATLARFFFVSDPDGYKIEVIQKGGRFG